MTTSYLLQQQSAGVRVYVQRGPLNVDWFTGGAPGDRFRVIDEFALHNGTKFLKVKPIHE